MSVCLRMSLGRVPHRGRGKIEHAYICPYRNNLILNYRICSIWWQARLWLFVIALRVENGHYLGQPR